VRCAVDLAAVEAFEFVGCVRVLTARKDPMGQSDCQDLQTKNVLLMELVAHVESPHELAV
jgi:hypothetical protein